MKLQRFTPKFRSQGLAPFPKTKGKVVGSMSAQLVQHLMSENPFHTKNMYASTICYVLLLNWIKNVAKSTDRAINLNYLASDTCSHNCFHTFVPVHRYLSRFKVFFYFVMILETCKFKSVKSITFGIKIYNMLK